MAQCPGRGYCCATSNTASAKEHEDNCKSVGGTYFQGDYRRGHNKCEVERRKYITFHFLLMMYQHILNFFSYLVSILLLAVDCGDFQARIRHAEK